MKKRFKRIYIEITNHCNRSCSFCSNGIKPQRMMNLKEFEHILNEIDDFTDDRDSNFTQADEALAKQKGCTPEEVAKWRRDNGYTWHECKDCKTMQKVPTEVHGNVSHSGGVSEYKSNKGNTSHNDGQ